MPDVLAALILGVVQGLTEFLPISSSAHLILARAFFAWNSDLFGLAFDVALHAGTLIAIVWYFWADVLAMIKAAPAVLTARTGPGKLARLIVIGTIPVVIVGVVAADWLEDNLRTPTVIAVTLTIGGLMLLAAEWFGRQRREEGSVSAVDSFLMGAAQSTALVPGMSRSGSTISMAMYLGMTRQSAARFSFLLGIPAIAAAAAKEGLHVFRMGVASHELLLFFVGMVASAVVGYLTIRYFLRYLASHSLSLFAWYRLALAAITVVWLMR